MAGLLERIGNKFGKKEQAEEEPEMEHLSEGEVIAYIDDEFTRRMKERRPFELQWRLNISFIEGNQFVEINPIGMTIDEMPKAYWWQEREAFNHIGPLIETRKARLNRMRPILKTKPHTNDPEDIRSAKVGSTLLKNIYYKQGIADMMGETYAWMESTGTVLYKNIWNSNLGPLIVPHDDFDFYGLIRDEAQEESLIDHLTRQSTQSDLREGDLEAVLCSPFEILPDSPYHQNINQCRSIIHAKAYHVDEIYEIWGIEVTAEQTSSMKLHHAPIGQGGLGYGRGEFQFSSLELENHAVVKEYWEMPSRKYSAGRLILVCSDKLLYYGPLPYPCGEDGSYALPFAKAVCIERPGVFWGKSVVDRVIPVQRRYNSIKNRKAEYLNRAAIGNWFVQEGSVDLDDFEAGVGSPGYIATVKRGFNYPQQMETKPLPAQFGEELQSLLNEFNIFTGVSDLSKQSKAPPGVKSGVALSLALEQDDTRISLVANNIEKFLVECGKQWLRLYRHFVSSSRTLREIGKNNVIELIDWTGDDLRTDDVVVEASSAMAESPAQRRQMVFDLVGSGLLFDPDTGRIDKETRAKIFEMIEFGNWEDADASDKLHTAKADRENLTMLNGMESTPVVYDDHVLHIYKHNNFRLTNEYEQMITENPMIDEIMQMHVDVHLMFIAPDPREQMMGQPQPGQQQAGQAGPPPQQQPMEEPAPEPMPDYIPTDDTPVGEEVL